MITELITLLETALNTDHKHDRGPLFEEALSDMSEVQVTHAFRRAVKSWKPAFGRTFPSPAELREYAEELDPPRAPQVHEHQPTTTDFLRNARRSGVTPEEIQAWLEEGKAKQRELIRRIQAGEKTDYVERMDPNTILPECDLEKLPKGWSLYDWQRAKVTLEAKR